MKSAKLMLVMCLCFLVANPSLVAAAFEKEDDDDGVADFMIGLAIGLCDANETCSHFLSIFSLIICMIALTAWCVGGWEPDFKHFTSKELAYGGGGYLVGRQLGK